MESFIKEREREKESLILLLSLFSCAMTLYYETLEAKMMSFETVSYSCTIELSIDKTIAISSHFCDNLIIL
jgi:hypothetical protein